MAVLKILTHVARVVNIDASAFAKRGTNTRKVFGFQELVQLDQNLTEARAREQSLFKADPCRSFS
jgi:hypothetical protein